MSKHKYDKSEIVQSEDFELDDYVNRDLFRQAKRDEAKEKSSSDLSKLYALINDSENPIKYISRLTDVVNSNFPDLAETLYSNYYIFKSYIEDKRDLKFMEDAHGCDKLSEIEERYEVKFEEFAADLESKLSERNEYIAFLKQYIAKLVKTDMENQEYKKLVDTYETFQLFESPDIEIL